ncbi:DedA family protein [Opitutus sp. ER46]|uniref:DedA family protein n=1 Tax=Opitutus sp. ER46 TaxID=2161864 RepID=UPI000D2FE613|nr:DedA family protein [Opitutus sp. ER46]PTX98936.1 DedA family protein [Opitutus sp. ER46]
MHDFFKPLFDWYAQSLDTGGYWLVALLMAIESSIIPLPSELVIPPAAIIAQRSGSNMTLTGIVIAGTVGSWIGATAMYWASRLAGRPLVMRYGKFIFISPAKVEQAERWAAEFGSFGIFASRLLPVVRHLIGIPAGIVRMNYVTFSIYTILGSAVWCSVLCWVGIKAGQDEALMQGELHRIAIWLIGALAVLGAIYYFFVHRFTHKRR